MCSWCRPATIIEGPEYFASKHTKEFASYCVVKGTLPDEVTEEFHKHFGIDFGENNPINCDFLKFPFIITFFSPPLNLPDRSRYLHLIL